MRLRPSLGLLVLLVVLVSPTAAAACGGTAFGGIAQSGLAPAGDVVDQLMASMTLPEKVGQLFVTRVYGARADTHDASAVAANRRALGVDNAAQLVDRYHVGGVIYFEWAGNLRNPEQVAQLSNGIQRAALGTDSRVPLLISTDQENGAVIRLGPPATQFPGSMALGASRDAPLARNAANVTGQELKAVGINQNLAPVADVNLDPQNPVIGVRSFGSQPALDATLTRAQVRGFQLDAGIAATAKHFPGHGDTNVDSHTGLPVIHHSRQAWERKDAPPFRAAIAADVDVIMTAHISVPSLDPSGLPATLSRPIVTGILRRELGYEGVVMTDSLGMAGVRAMFTDGQIAVRAIKAGVDLLLNPPRIARSYNAVLRAVRNGDLSRSRIDRSVRRILELKQRLGLFDNALVNVGHVGDVVGTAAHERVARQVANESITLVRNRNGMLPVAVNGRRVLVTGWSQDAVNTLGNALDGMGALVTRRWTGAGPSSAVISGAVAAARSRDLVVVLTGNVRSDAAQRTLVRRLVDTGTPVVTVAVREPYDIAWYAGSARAHLATYSTSAASMAALARVISGKRDPVGRLPVTVPRAGSSAVLYRFGYGLGY
jgi:beta-N-acetylhexosaminidase